MNLNPNLKRGSVVAGLAMVLAGAAPSALANVYATHIQFNGTSGNLSITNGQSVIISYILNEPASAGVTVKILSGSEVVRSLTVSPYMPGTDRGLNSVTWDGLDSNSNNVALGAYSVSITAASAGYQGWTQTTDDANPLNYVYWGQGIAVDQNPASPFYGRVYVANAFVGPDPSGRVGDAVGIYKLNADASPAEDGVFSSGGLDWVGEGRIPWKLQVSADDYLYVSDAANGGLVYRWDPAVTPGAQAEVLRTNNQPVGANLGGLFVTGAGTNTRIWMTVSNAAELASGIRRWSVGADGLCASNDVGVTVIGAAGSGASLTQPPAELAVDQNGNIYTCQAVDAPADPAGRVFGFAAYDPSTNGGVPALTAAWSVGSGNDEYGLATGIAVDPTGKYLAVSFLGISSGLEKGNTKILSATNGSLVANLDLDISISGYSAHQDIACVWDAVGNVYYVDNWIGRWRAVSPPGTNHAITVAVNSILVGGYTPSPPQITGISLSAQIVTLEFTGQPDDSAGAFTLVSASSVAGTYSNTPNANIITVAPGQFRATAPATAPAQFYRIRR